MDAMRMTQRVRLLRKGSIGSSSPETWSELPPSRRAAIDPISDAASLREAAAYNWTATHQALVDYRDDYKPEGHGSRALKRVHDGAEFIVLRTVGEGHIGRTGHQRYMRLMLAQYAGDGSLVGE